MDKIHTDDEPIVLDFSKYVKGDYAEFKTGQPDELIGLSEGAVNSLNTLEPGTDVKVVCIAPGKFEVWA